MKTKKPAKKNMERKQRQREIVLPSFGAIACLIVGIAAPSSGIACKASGGCMTKTGRCGYMSHIANASRPVGTNTTSRYPVSTFVTAAACT